MNRQSGDQHWTRQHPDRVRRGAAAAGAKLTDAQIDEVCALATYFGPSALARQFSVSRQTIWRHLRARGLV